MYSPTIIFSLAAFVGNFGVALTGFGMAIFFLFVYTIGDLSGGMTCDRCGIKDAVFYQSLALSSGLPFMLYQARAVIKKNANKTFLLVFCPATAAGTPIGKFLQGHLPGEIVKTVCGILICLACANALLNLIPETQCYKKYVSKEAVNEDDKEENVVDADVEDRKENFEGDIGKEEAEPKKDDELDTASIEGWSFKIWGFIAGFFSGFLGGLAGIRGPPLMVFFLWFTFPKHFVRANSMLVLVVNISIRLVYYVVEDLSGQRDVPWFEPELWYIYVCVVVFGILGVPVGDWVAQRINQKQFKLVIAFMLFLSGVSNLGKGVSEIVQR